VVVAVTAQNTSGVLSIHQVPSDVVADQFRALAEDLPPQALKTGMLATAELVRQVSSAVDQLGWDNLVVDPVMVATSGDRLLEENAEAEIRESLVPLARLVTPNLDEASILVGYRVDDEASMARAGERLLEMGARAALIKGGHLTKDTLVDVLVTPNGMQEYHRERIPTRSTHGTGCTLSAAITAGLALGRDLKSAVAHGLDFVYRAIAEAPGLGSGSGPLNHLISAEPGPSDRDG